MAALGSDFISSLRTLFKEAGENGRDGEIEFAHLRGKILEFITNCGQMSVAQARANCVLSFTNGTKSQTALAFPPGRLDIEQKRAQLGTARTGGEFIEILLQELINKQVSPRPSGKKNEASKKRSKSPPESPKSKAQKRLEDSPKKPFRIKVVRNYSKGIPKPPAFNIAQQQNRQRVPSPSKKDGSPEKIDPSMPSPMEIDSNIVPDPGECEANAAQKNSSNTDYTEGLTFHDPPHDQEDAHMEDVSAAKTEIKPVSGRPGTQNIINAVSDTEAHQWDEFKPKLLEMLDAMRAAPTPQECETGLKRLQSAFAQIKPETAHIPADTWNEYERELIAGADKGWFKGPWSERHFRVGRVIYLKEEEQVLVSRDWTRLRAAARVWAILTEMTAPPQEPVDQERANSWLVERLGDITFLEKMSAYKETVAATKGPEDP
ncbi:hypothetical protein F66182_4782 [Fusarium sp. NRRL 66182]|nr:hypothetical protein F66182_4782 [Fusarium sp. NRRL 66182]